MKIKHRLMDIFSGRNKTLKCMSNEDDAGRKTKESSVTLDSHTKKIKTGVFEPTTLIDDKFKYSFVCHNKKERNRAKRLFEKEKGTIAWIDRELRSDDVFYDIGANIGVYTIFAALRLGESGSAFAFEPHIPNANSLIENIFLNGLEHKVRLVTSALTSKVGYNKFNYYSMNAASSTSQYGGDSYEGASFDPKFVEIKHGCSIDSLCSHGILQPPSIVKIDVDGLDYEILEGMHGLLASSEGPREIQIELGTDTKPKIIKLCEDVGYVLKEKHWTEAGLNFIAKGGEPENTPYNAIFCHPKYT